MAARFPHLRLTCCIAVFAVCLARWNFASATVLEVGYGYGASPEAASAAALADLAFRLQRRAAVQLEPGSGQGAASLKRAIAGGRELPLLEIELVRTGTNGAEVLYQTRLTDRSLARYADEAGRLAAELRGVDPARLGGRDLADALARLDQYVRIRAVLGLFSSLAQPEVELDEAALWNRAARRLPAAAESKEVARRVKLELDKTGLSRCRIIAPVRADTGEATALSASVADELRIAASAAPADEPAACTLDGRYAESDGSLILTLFLLDASFNTQRAFVFLLPAAAERRNHNLASASAFAASLNRGLVRVELPNQGGTALASDNVMRVNVRMGRGNRGLYYRPGERDKLLVKLDRPGHYYIVGHVEKGVERFSYLLEIGEQGANDRFVRRVTAEQVQRWQTVVEFTVEAPVGLEAVQVFATSGPPDRMLPATRFDPVRKLYLVGTDPADTIKRTRGLVLVNIQDAPKQTGGNKKRVPLAVGEAVLQFSTLLK